MSVCRKILAETPAVIHVLVHVPQLQSDREPRQLILLLVIRALDQILVLGLRWKNHATVLDRIVMLTTTISQDRTLTPVPEAVHRVHSLVLAHVLFLDQPLVRDHDRVHTREIEFV